MLEQRGDIVVIGVVAFGNVRIFFSVFAKLLVKLNLFFFLKVNKLKIKQKPTPVWVCWASARKLMYKGDREWERKTVYYIGQSERGGEAVYYIGR